MIIALLAAGVSALALPAMVRPLGRWLEAARWARLCTAALLAGALTVEVTAVLWAGPTVLRAVGLPALASMCARMLGRLIPGGPTAGWAAFVVALTVAGLAARAVRTAGREAAAAVVEASLGEHLRAGAHEHVVLPTSRPIAVSVPGPPTQILISEGLRQRLTPEQLDVVLAHEAAHLDHDHHRYLLLATAIESAFAVSPLARRSAAALRAALERWADDVATGGDPARRQGLRQVLLDVVDLPAAADLAALSAASTVLERLDALDRPPARPSRWFVGAITAPWVALGATISFAAGSWMEQARWVFAMVGHCS